jgi:flavin-dependent dehydrogenase
VTLEAPAPAPANALIVASRAALDSALVAKARDAGAEILAARVKDVVISGGSRTNGCGFRIETVAGTRHAARLIGADGANSLVRRRLAQAFTRGQLSLATGYFAHGVTSDEIVIELVADPAGYVWSFPRPTHLAIGVCAEAAAGVTAETLRARVSEWIRSTAVAPGARLEPYSWPIPSLGRRDFDRLAVSGPGWCLVGDAAGLVDPITREGIYFALLSGQWAAEALASDGSDWWRGYAQRVRDEIASELARAARFKTEFFHPRFTRTLVHGLRHSAKIRAVMADLVAGRQGYAGLKWRLLETLEVGLALKLARSYFAR